MKINEIPILNSPNWIRGDVLNLNDKSQLIIYSHVNQSYKMYIYKDHWALYFNENPNYELCIFTETNSYDEGPIFTEGAEEVCDLIKEFYPKIAKELYKIYCW